MDVLALTASKLHLYYLISFNCSGTDYRKQIKNTILKQCNEKNNNCTQHLEEQEYINYVVV